MASSGFQNFESKYLIFCERLREKKAEEYF